VKDKDEARQSACPLCGGADFEFGSLLAQGLKYIPDDENWRSKTANLMSEVRGRRCKNCGNLLLMASEV
jgi:hypothetical protein